MNAVLVERELKRDPLSETFDSEKEMRTGSLRMKPYLCDEGCPFRCIDVAVEYAYDAHQESLK